MRQTGVFVVRSGRTVALRLCVALGVLSLGGCDSEQRGDSFSVYSTDRSGVNLVTNRGRFPSEPVSWWIPPEPDMRIHGEAPEIGGFFRVRSAIRLRSGTFVVLNAGGKEVDFIRPNGTPIKIVTASGHGPREFRQALQMAAHPNGGVGLWDANLGRILVLDSIGEVVNSTDLSQAGNMDEYWGTNWVWGGLRGVLSDGSFLMVRPLPIAPLPSQPDGVRQRYVPELYSPIGSLIHRFDTLRGPPQVPRPGNPRPMLRPFHQDPIVRVSGQQVFVADPETAEIRVYSVGGDLVRVVRRENPDLAVDGEGISWFIDFQLSPLEPGPERRAIRENLEGLPYPDLFSPFQALVVSSDGRILVQEPGGCREGIFCWVFYDRNGRFDGRVDIPHLMVVEQLDRNTVVGLNYRSMGEPEVVLYRLEER